jgi:hypothetical protein
LAMDPRLTLFRHDEWIIPCLKHDRRGRMSAKELWEGREVDGSLRRRERTGIEGVDVPICRSHGARCHMWSDCGIVRGRERNGNMGRRGGDGGYAHRRDPRAMPVVAATRGWREGGGLDRGFVSMTPSNGKSNPATQHAGGGRADRKECEGEYEPLRTILIWMRRMWAGNK